MTKHTVKLTFRDENIPPIFVDEKTHKAAVATASRLINQFAGVKCVFVDDPDEGLRHVANANGDYLFSIPLDAI